MGKKLRKSKRCPECFTANLVKKNVEECYSFCSACGATLYPIETPQNEKPTLEELMEWESEGICEATDGCVVEPDGVCPHGHQSWLLELRLI